MSVQKPVKTSLPALPASAAPDMRMYLERVREELSRIQAGSSSTTVVIGGGSSSSSGTGGGTGGGGGGVDPGTLPCGAPVTPTAPTNFQVTAGFNFFMVEWDLPTYCGHSHTEVYGTKDDGAQGTEVLLGTTGGTIFSLAEPNTGVRRCFWAKHVNLVGVKGPYNGTEGTCDTTALDPGHLIEVLTGQITATELYKDLGEQIELLPQFDAAITDLNSAVGQLAEGVMDISVTTEDQCLINGVNDPSQTTEAACTGAGGLWVAGSTSTLKGVKESTDASLAAIVQLNTVTASSTSANAKSTAGLVVKVDLPDGQTLTGYVVDQSEAWANGEGVLGEKISGVEALATTGPAQRPNMCPNSNFEQGLEGIAYAGCAPYVDAGWSFGRALVANATNSTGCQVVFPQFRANPGDTLNVTFDAQVHNPTGGYVSFLRFYSALGNPFTPDRGSVDGTYRSGSCYLSDDPAQRTRFLVRAPVPAGTAYAAFGFYCAGGIQQLILRRPQACGGPLPMPPYSSEAAGSQTAARVINVETARIGYCSKNGETTADGTKEACQANGGTWNIGLPWATAVKQVSVTYNGQTVALQQQFSAISTDTGGLKAQYSVKIDNNGLVSGFGLASEPVVGGGSTSAFGVRADRFWIAAPTDTKNPTPPPARLPFIVTTTSQTIDGEVFPAGVYIQEAFINAATISTAKIKNAAITDAKILNLSAEKILAGSIGVDRFIKSNNYIAGQRGWIIASGTTADLNSAYAEFNNVTYRGTLIGGGATGYASGSSAGLWSGMDGGVYKFRVGATDGSRMAWDGSTLQVVGDIQAASGRIWGTLYVGKSASALTGLRIEGAKNRLIVSNSAGQSRVSIGDAQDGSNYGIFIRDRNNRCAVSSWGTNGLPPGELDGWGEDIYRTDDFYIGAAYIKKLRAGNIDNRTITDVTQASGSWGPSSLGTGAVQVAIAYYTVADLPAGETAEAVVTGSVTVYPSSGSPYGGTFICGLRADGANIGGASSAVYTQNTAQCMAFTGKATVGNGSHYFQLVAQTQSGTFGTVQFQGQVTVMLGKR